MRLALLLFALPLAAQTSFVTSFNPVAALRNDFAGFVGTKFTVGANPITVTALGRMCVLGNSQTHTVEIVSDNLRAIVTVNMAGCSPGQYVYASNPTHLDAGATYYLASQETQGGDRWYDQGVIQTTNVATVASSIYQWNGTWYPSSANSSYGPVSFQYGGTVTPPAPQPAPAPTSGVTMSLGTNQCTLIPSAPGIIKITCLAGTVDVHDETNNIGSGSSMVGSWAFTNGTISWQLSPGTGTAVNYQITNGGTPKTGTF